MSEAADLQQSSIGCVWCETHPDGPCPDCTRSRRRAIRLRDERGMSSGQIAATLNIDPDRVRRLLGEADQDRDMQQFKLDTFPVAQLRDLFYRRVEEDPRITEASIARAANMHRIDLRRAIGQSPAKARMLAAGRQEPTAQTQVTVATASRIVRALGYAPHEIDGL